MFNIKNGKSSGSGMGMENAVTGWKTWGNI